MPKPEFPGQAGKDKAAANKAKGGEHPRGGDRKFTVTAPDGTTEELTNAEIKARRADLLAQGYTGHGLDDDDTEEAPAPVEGAPV